VYIQEYVRQYPWIVPKVSPMEGIRHRFKTDLGQEREVFCVRLEKIIVVREMLSTSGL
jgi:hypothetical protein